MRKGEMKIELHAQVSTSSIFVMILALPPRGIVSCLPHALHFTLVLAQPKMIWVELHSVQEIFKNRDFGAGNTWLSFVSCHHVIMHYTNSYFLRRCGVP